MFDQGDRLARCFASVFPTLTMEEIRQLSFHETGVLDSLSIVTLAAVIQEEFNVEIDPSYFSNVDSFESLESYVRRLSLAGD